MSNAKAKEAIVNKALHYFNVEGWNCAESVYMAIFKEYYKINVTPKTVTAYGGGIARTGSICGAVNVAIMGLSQKYGRENPHQPFIKTQRPIFQFLNQIVDQYGSIHCSRLTNAQLTTLEGIRKFRDQNIKENLCTPLIRKIMETFLQMVENNKPT
jgi:C_GCAxxG_C_C family probable redox protein